MTIKEKVLSAIPICGTHVNLSDTIVTEIFASLGYDFIWVDMEHTSLSCEQVYHHLLAAKACQTPLFVRVPEDDLTVTKKVLEMGIDGIVFPMVKNAEHAKQLLDFTLYPPYGKRGCGPKGAVHYGLDNETAYYENGHLNLCRFVQIEQVSAVEEAAKIAAIPHLDGCVLGMHDLSGSINRLGDIFCEENLSLANKAIQAFAAVKKTVGISTFSTDPVILNRYRSMGINMLTSGADYDYILQKAQDTLKILKNNIS